MTMKNEIRQIIDDEGVGGAVDILVLLADALQDKANALYRDDKKGYALYTRRARHLYKTANEILTGYFHGD